MENIQTTTMLEVITRINAYAGSCCMRLIILNIFLGLLLVTVPMSFAQNIETNSNSTVNSTVTNPSVDTETATPATVCKAALRFANSAISAANENCTGFRIDSGQIKGLNCNACIGNECNAVRETNGVPCDEIVKKQALINCADSAGRGQLTTEPCAPSNSSWESTDFQ